MENPKVIVEDYTQLPPKIKTRKGETGKCPRCQRTGLIENRDGRMSYFHRLGYELIPSEPLPGIMDETCFIGDNPQTKPPK
jgi:hypothetical protein